MSARSTSARASRSDSPNGNQVENHQFVINDSTKNNGSGGAAVSRAAAPTIPLPVLYPGDILLYGGGFIGALIEFRTWSDVSHLAVYAGAGRAMESRKDGPREYPLRILGLRRVIRPVAPFSFAAGRKWFDETASKLPYGYSDLGRFYSVTIITKGLICSQFGDVFFQKCGLPLFNPNYPTGAVCPRDFETLSPLLVMQTWSWK